MKKLIYIIIIGIFTLMFATLPFLSNSMHSSRNPYTYYRVYYNGELLGTVKSEDELLNYINDNNDEYSFSDKVKAGIYDDLYIDFSTIQL